MHSSLASLVTLQRTQLTLPAMRPLTREGSLPSCSESSQTPVHSDRAKNFEHICCGYGPHHLEARHRSPQDMFDASCQCSLDICGVSGRLFLDTCDGAQRANFWHLRKKLARHEFAKQCEASPPQNSEVGRSCAPLAPQSRPKPPQKTMVLKSKIAGWLTEHPSCLIHGRNKF